MKVTLPGSSKVPQHEIRPGECYRYGDSSEVFMRLDLNGCATATPGYGMLAIGLRDGLVRHGAPNSLVERVPEVHLS